MKDFMIKVLFLGVFLLPGDGVKAQELDESCYPVSSAEAASILGNDESEFSDNHFKWVVDKVGWELTCLGIDNTCNGGDFQVSEGVFHNGKCTYTITNVAEGDVMGESTHITLKRQSL